MVAYNVCMLIEMVRKDPQIKKILGNMDEHKAFELVLYEAKALMLEHLETKFHPRLGFRIKPANPTKKQKEFRNALNKKLEEVRVEGIRSSPFDGMYYERRQYL